MINSVTVSNPNLNSLLTSAQNAFSAGDALLNKAANQIVSPPPTAGAAGANAATAAATAALAPSGLPPLTPGEPGSSATIAGFANLIRGQSDVLAGVALAHVYQRTTQDLMNMLAPPRRPVG